MKQKKSGVFFIDILGFSALTKGQIKNILEEDFQAWELKEVEYDSSFLSAKIILEFRSTLQQLKEKYPAIDIGQLSDCAFIWSDDIVLLMQAVHFMMWTMIGKKGILCRGGVSYGDIVEISNVDYKSGAFIVGNAVTNAVKNEGRLKGPRVPMDLTVSDMIQKSFKRDSFVMYLSQDLFHNIESMIDMNQVDEYRWYLYDDDMITDSSVGMPSLNTKIRLTKQRLKLANVLKSHPRMRWNSLSEDGRIQLKAGVKSLTENGLLDILHNFEMNDIYNFPRTMKNLLSFDASVDNDTYYTTAQRNEWLARLENLD